MANVTFFYLVAVAVSLIALLLVAQVGYFRTYGPDYAICGHSPARDALVFARGVVAHARLECGVTTDTDNKYEICSPMVYEFNQTRNSCVVFELAVLFTFNLLHALAPTIFVVSSVFITAGVLCHMSDVEIERPWILFAAFVASIGLSFVLSFIIGYASSSHVVTVLSQALVDTIILAGFILSGSATILWNVVSSGWSPMFVTMFLVMIWRARKTAYDAGRLEGLVAKRVDESVIRTEDGVTTRFNNQYLDEKDIAFLRKHGYDARQIPTKYLKKLKIPQGGNGSNDWIVLRVWKAFRVLFAPQPEARHGVVPQMQTPQRCNVLVKAGGTDRGQGFRLADKGITLLHVLGYANTDFLNKTTDAQLVSGERIAPIRIIGYYGPRITSEMFGEIVLFEWPQEFNDIKPCPFTFDSPAGEWLKITKLNLGSATLSDAAIQSRARGDGTLAYMFDTFFGDSGSLLSDKNGVARGVHFGGGQYSGGCGIPFTRGMCPGLQEALKANLKDLREMKVVAEPAVDNTQQDVGKLETRAQPEAFEYVPLVDLPPEDMPVKEHGKKATPKVAEIMSSVLEPVPVPSRVQVTAAPVKHSDIRPERNPIPGSPESWEAFKDLVDYQTTHVKVMERLAQLCEKQTEMRSDVDKTLESTRKDIVAISSSVRDLALQVEEFQMKILNEWRKRDLAMKPEALPNPVPEPVQPSVPKNFKQVEHVPHFAPVVCEPCGIVVGVPEKADDVVKLREKRAEHTKTCVPSLQKELELAKLAAVPLNSSTGGQSGGGSGTTQSKKARTRARRAEKKKAGEQSSSPSTSGSPSVTLTPLNQ